VRKGCTLSGSAEAPVYCWGPYLWADERGGGALRGRQRAPPTRGRHGDGSDKPRAAVDLEAINLQRECTVEGTVRHVLRGDRGWRVHCRE
jgi:hypothetical protein